MAAAIAGVDDCGHSRRLRRGEQLDEDLSRVLDRSGQARPPAASRRPLVLSLFPGIDLLGRAFQAAGFCVVRGPDTLLDDPIEAWAGTTGFDGIIGGPPCQNYSDANRHRDQDEGDRLLREYLRILEESQPLWFLIENVRNVPDVEARGYQVQRLDLTDAECGGPQWRLRHIQFGHRLGWIIRPPRANAARSVTRCPTVTTAQAGPGDRHYRRCHKQGLGESLPLRSLTKTARRRVIGNAVPLSIGASLATAVSQAGPVTDADCICLCGRRVTRPARHATAACRKRMERKRREPRRVVAWSDKTATGSQPGGVTPERSHDGGELGHE